MYSTNLHPRLKGINQNLEKTKDPIFKATRIITLACQKTRIYGKEPIIIIASTTTDLILFSSYNLRNAYVK